jgi:hypothetical protein
MQPATVNNESGVLTHCFTSQKLRCRCLIGTAAVLPEGMPKCIIGHVRTILHVVQEIVQQQRDRSAYICTLLVRPTSGSSGCHIAGAAWIPLCR